LEGPQGIRKSSALRVIGGSWFTEQHENANDHKRFSEILEGKLLVEISEMDAFQRSEMTRVKAAITNRSDRYRGSYDPRATDHPRQCIFVGTTNRDDWNRDETGARRFWPIKCHGIIDVEAIATDRLQLYAEAVARFKAGESWWETPTDETKEQQASRYVEPAWVAPIQRYIEYEPMLDDIPLNQGEVDQSKGTKRLKPLQEVTIAQILQYALRIPTSQWPVSQPLAARALKYLSWESKQIWKEGEKKTIRLWLAPNHPKRLGQRTLAQAA
jgi:putative DNA primase/helicase